MQLFLRVNTIWNGDQDASAANDSIQNKLTSHDARLLSRERDTPPHSRPDVFNVRYASCTIPELFGYAIGTAWFPRTSGKMESEKASIVYE